MIIVTGATGTLGSQIVQQLLERIPADRIGVSVRDTARAADLAARGVRVRQGDFAAPDSLVSAFEGATQLLLISSNETGGSAVARHTAAIDAACAAGAARILYTSHQGAAADSLFAPMPDHAATERYLAETGTPCTSLRNGFYASTVPLLLGRALETGELAAPADGPVSWTTHGDLAAAIARILTEDPCFDGPTPPLTAPNALDLKDIAAILTDLTGRPIHRVVIDDEEWVAGLIDHGVPASQATMLLGMFHASRNGEFTTTGTALGSLLGRTPTPLRAVLAGLITAN
ncbi:NmrA family NAD(P)-binding protein [Nocardia sp. NBC_01327]|uniref:NmrA family NAD(P)-binding protein n=1 Tax=Nocardia sp. NBC_01327 TaxID=2903593 RepID=UPI002E0D1E0B|nr:NAD(P)H-binding protein [Nocardia sp. NBC_01327]